jgi:AAA15 family ATPase/GTPase
MDMINYLKIKNHKALTQAQLTELGHINVICGKNNSGKTTVLQALLIDDCHSIGKKVDSVDWLMEIWKEKLNKYSEPSSGNTINFIREYLTGLVADNAVWFSDNYDGISGEIQDAQKKDSYLNKFAGDFWSTEKILDEFFRKARLFFNPILIPPKRQLDFQSTINLNQPVTPHGDGIINKLFFIKNQDLDTSEYSTYKKIYSTFSDITDAKFNIIPDQNNQIKLFYNTDGNWIPASDSGLGLSDVLIIISILNLLDSNVFLIEEPENHLHATYQKRLLKYLKSLKSKQFFITTHSSVFLDINMVSKIFYCEKKNGEIVVSDQTSKSEIIHSLGYSITENLVADLIILLEGPTDIPVIQEMLEWMGISATYNVKFWALGGDIMASLDLSVFAERNNVYALVDSDPGSSVQRTRFINNCAETGIRCKKLERYSIENYFPLDAVKLVFPNQIPTEIRNISHKKAIDVQLGFKEKNKSIKNKNAEIVKHMKLSDIEGTDLYKFLEDIKSFLLQN